LVDKYVKLLVASFMGLRAGQVIEYKPSGEL